MKNLNHLTWQPVGCSLLWKANYQFKRTIHFYQFVKFRHCSHFIIIPFFSNKICLQGNAGSKGADGKPVSSDSVLSDRMSRIPFWFSDAVKWNGSTSQGKPGQRGPAGKDGQRGMKAREYSDTLWFALWNALSVVISILSVMCSFRKWSTRLGQVTIYRQSRWTWIFSVSIKKKLFARNHLNWGLEVYLYLAPILLF